MKYFIFMFKYKMTIILYKILLNSSLVLTFNNYRIDRETLVKLLKNLDIHYIILNIPIFNSFNMITSSINTPSNKWFNKIIKGYDPTLKTILPESDTTCNKIILTSQSIKII